MALVGALIRGVWTLDLGVGMGDWGAHKAKPPVLSKKCWFSCHLPSCDVNLRTAVYMPGTRYIITEGGAEMFGVLVYY